MNLKKSFFILALVIPFLFSGCARKGCTDTNSTNYDASAKTDDGTCEYEGSVVMWYAKDVSEGLTSIGSTSLTFYVDGEIVGSTATSVYWTSAPDCGQNGSITITKNLGIATNKSYSYSVVDEYGDEWWSGTLNFTGNTCFALQLD